MKLLKPAILVLLFCLGAFVSFQGRADNYDETDPNTNTMTPEKMVNAYYNRCLNTVFQDMAPETREEFCACTSAHVKDSMSQSDLETMATGKGKPVDQKILATKVMAPCLAAPMEELEYNTCMGDITYAHFFQTNDAYNATCHCVSNGIAKFIGDYGYDLMAMLAKMNITYTENPTDSMRQSAQYVTERARLHKDCLNTYAGQ